MSTREPLVGATTDDRRVIAALRAGEEAAFAEIFDRYHRSLVRIAMRYVPSRAIAEEVAQDTWIGLIEGIDRFEGRSTLKTWLYKILIYKARARGTRERRSVPMSALQDDDGQPLVDPDRFRPSGALWAGHWVSPPRRWDGDAEDRLLSGEATGIIERVIEVLPVMQRDVIVMRDLSHFTAAEVCDLLGITEANQRVLLHRARTRVRAALELYLDA